MAPFQSISFATSEHCFPPIPLSRFLSLHSARAADTGFKTANRLEDSRNSLLCDLNV